jgi:hypothetical protein
MVDGKSILTGIILLSVSGTATALFGWLRCRREGKKIEKWLRENTKDEPGKSHRTVANIARVLGMHEDHVNKAIAKKPAIYRSSKNNAEVSVWRAEPESVYERRGVRVV